jgi:hypothetical protein
MLGTERSRQWLWRGVTVVAWSLAIAAIAAFTGDERFTATLVLTFAAIIALLHALVFVSGRVWARIRRS